MSAVGPPAGLVLVAVLATAAAGRWAVVAARGAESLDRLRREAGAPVVPAWFAHALVRAEVALPPERAWRTARLVAVGAVVAGLVVVPVVAPLLVPLALVLAAVAATAGPAVMRRRQRRAFTAELPLAVEALVAALVGGSSLGQALDAAATRAGPVGTDLRLVQADLAHGRPLAAALDGWAEARPGTGVRLLVDALAIAGTSGGSRARALEVVGATLREREALAREVHALGSQARASAAVLLATPVAFAAVTATLDPRVRQVLLGRPVGWACLAGGVLLDGAGAWWMSRLVGAVR